MPLWATAAAVLLDMGQAPPVKGGDSEQSLFLGQWVGLNKAAHAVARHGTERMTTQGGLGFALDYAAGQFGIEGYSQEIALAANLLVFLPWGRDHELEADEQYEAAGARILHGLDEIYGRADIVLKATKEVPRRLMHPKRKSIGIRIPDNRIALALAQELNEPIMSTTLILPGEDMPMTDPYDMRDTLGHAVDLVIDGGFCGLEPTTVIDLTESVPEVIRQGKGSFERLL